MLIGVTGRAQHGKDAIGRFLVQEYDFSRYAFADQLKSMALALNPWIDDLNGSEDSTFIHSFGRLKNIVADWGWAEAKELSEVRRFLQVLGTEGVRNHLGEDSWVKALERKMQQEGALKGRNVRSVITDVRFPNEAAWVRSRGGEVWRVQRVVNGMPFDNGMGADHASEKFIDDLPADRVMVASSLAELGSLVEIAVGDISG